MTPVVAQAADQPLIRWDWIADNGAVIWSRTLEHLETAGVPVLGWRHDWFPAFYTRSSGLRLAHRVETATEVAAIFAARTRPGRGLLLAVPIPVAVTTKGRSVPARQCQPCTGCVGLPMVSNSASRPSAGNSIAQASGYTFTSLIRREGRGAAQSRCTARPPAPDAARTRTSPIAPRGRPRQDACT